MSDNAFISGLLANERLMGELTKRIGTDLAKADTFTQATGLLWYDLSQAVQLLVPDVELYPLISRLPRVPGNGGNAHHWKRITDINANQTSAGVSEGNRGARIAVTEQDQVALYKTLGLESSTTWEARLGAKNLSPDPLGIQAQATLQDLRIAEEQSLILGNASTALGVTPTPVLTVAGTKGAWGGTVTVYVICVALSGFGFRGYTPYNSTTNQGGIPSQITKVNADGSVDTFGGGSAQPSAEISTAGVTATQVVTATVAVVPGAVAYAWYVGTSSGAETLAGITGGPQAAFTKPGAYGVSSGTSQPVINLKVSGSYIDNSLNTLLPDGMFSQLYGTVQGTGYTTSMGTNPVLPGNVSTLKSGALNYQCSNGNTGLTVQGTNINEFDAVFQAAYDQFKIGYDEIFMSSTDITNLIQNLMSQGANTQYRILFDADETTGRIIAGRRITGYMNKYFNKPLDISVHPYLPPGNTMFWSDRVPFRLANTANPLEVITRQDYFAVNWPQRTRRYEYGIYADETFALNLAPGYAIISGINPTTGVPTF